MTATGTTTLLGVAAEAALGVPGVTCLEPRLARRLAAAVVPTRADVIPLRASPEEGVRADRAQNGTGWHIEVRCVLAEGHQALDIARRIHDRVGAAVLSRLAMDGVEEPVTVRVTVTRIAASARYENS